MLAKNVNDNAGFLNKRGACEFFASKLAPTTGHARAHIFARDRPVEACTGQIYLLASDEMLTITFALKIKTKQRPTP
ncbi:hypothetical protein DK871_18585 [Pseudomonas sp. L13]|nr:hypothetical protein [Pseudomonas sp. L13]